MGSLDGFRERVPYDPAVYTMGITCFRHYLIIWERRNGLSSFLVQSERTREVWSVDFPESVYTVEAGPNREYEAEHLCFRYESLVVRSS